MQILFSIQNVWNQLIYQFHIVVEYPTGPQTLPSYMQAADFPPEDLYFAPIISRAEMKRQSFYLKTDESSSAMRNADNLYLCCAIALLGHFCLYTAKTMFELSLGISKFTNFLELGHLAAIFVVSIVYMIEIALK